MDEGLDADDLEAAPDEADGDSEQAAADREHVASVRNWPRMSTRRAPMAFRMPISRVRSVTSRA